MDHLVPNDSGNCVRSIFYEFNVVSDPGDALETAGLIRSFRHDGAGSSPEPVRFTLEPAYIEKSFGCPLDKSHVTGESWRTVKIKVRSEGDFVPDLVRATIDDEMDQPARLCTSVLANSLRAAKFRGLGLRRTHFVPTKLRAAGQNFEEHPLEELQFLGRPCERPFLVQNAPNVCPSCHSHPVVCPGCAAMFIGCPNCDQSTWTIARWHKGPTDNRLIICDVAKRPFDVFDGAKWDGADFISSRTLTAKPVVTKRVIDFLLLKNVVGFLAQPALVCTDGMTAQQQKWLKEAVEPIG